MNRLLFCQMHLALDLISIIDIVFPDLSKIANFVTLKKKSLPVAAYVFFNIFLSQYLVSK